MSTYQESIAELSDATCHMHQALLSLREELEAIDSYNQRADVCTDQKLKAILLHNRDEEKEHAAMLLEWIRRNDAKFAKELKGQLFSKKNMSTVATKR
jgi:hypothetical protein